MILAPACETRAVAQITRALVAHLAIARRWLAAGAGSASMKRRGGRQTCTRTCSLALSHGSKTRGTVHPDHAAGAGIPVPGLYFQVPLVVLRQAGTMADADHRGFGQALRQQAVDRGFAGLVQRASGYVQKLPAGAVHQCARIAERPLNQLHRRRRCMVEAQA